MDDNINRLQARVKRSITKALKQRDAQSSLFNLVLSKPTFSYAKHHLEQIFENLRRLRGLPLNELPSNELSELYELIFALQKEFVELETLSLLDREDTQAEVLLADRIVRLGEELWEVCIRWVPYLELEKNRLAEISEELRKTITAYKKEATQTASQINKRLDDANQVMSHLETVSTEHGSAVFTRYFSDDADKYQKYARVWIFITSFLALLTIAFIFVLFLCSLNPINISATQLIQLMAPKIMLMVVLFTITVWCSRIYKILLHQEAVSRHRANSIQTLQAFRYAVDDPALKDQVVVEAARAVFGNMPTGMIGGNENSNDYITNVIEVARSAVSGGETK